MIKEIILMRHGQPNLTHVDKVSTLEMERWIEEYELSEIVDQPAPAASAELAKSANVIVASNAPRALTSVRALGLEAKLVDELFREAELPHGSWKRPRLSPFTWVFILRILWLCGFSGSVESIRSAKARAETAAQQLQSLADEATVLLVGHGFMNRMIAKQLEAAGSTRQQSTGSGYWGAMRYQLVSGPS
ncbi:histidine phosphatase family protein [Pseudomonas sp. v388]|uniref:histidine phosphatase family protein n=1 Tax=Pseudomonas sp. v388 TaxID=2479849 RepID=UPI000F776483|nr:histidine phosphatase family protein [Pseudomonas sp. v388]RRV10573.1 histidine phosphatase family protein [Pseudomonas sp. v388]